MLKGSLRWRGRERQRWMKLRTTVTTPEMVCTTLVIVEVIGESRTEGGGVGSAGEEKGMRENSRSRSIYIEKSRSVQCRRQQVVGRKQ